MNFKAAIFDLDGTLLDTLSDLGNSMNNVLNRNGFPAHTLERYKYMIGDGVEFLVTRALPEADRDKATVKKITEQYREEYNKSWNCLTRPYSGIPEMIDCLYSRSIRMAVLSNKPHDFTLKCVKEFLPFEKFEAVLGHKAGTNPKPDPSGAIEISGRFNIPPENFLYLGDTDVDMKTAVSAGMYPAGVLWGFRSAQELTENGAKTLLGNPLDLMNFLELN